MGVMVGVLVSLLFALSSPVAAQPSADERARVHFEAGRGYYDQGRFEDAAREFEEAYRLSPRPQLLYNISQASREAGNLPRAIESLRQYLAETPDAANRAALERRLRTMEEQQRGTQATAPMPEGPDPTGDEDSGGFPVGPVVIAVGGVAVIAGLITGWLALDAESSLEEMCPDGACPPSVDVDAEASRGQTLATVSDVLVFGGLAVAAGGLLVTVAF